MFLLVYILHRVTSMGQSHLVALAAVNIIADIDKARRQRYNNNYRKVINRQRRTYENIFYPPRRDRVEQP